MFLLRLCVEIKKYEAKELARPTSSKTPYCPRLNRIQSHKAKARSIQSVTDSVSNT